MEHIQKQEKEERTGIERVLVHDTYPLAVSQFCLCARRFPAAQSNCGAHSVPVKTFVDLQAAQVGQPYAYPQAGVVQQPATTSAAANPGSALMPGPATATAAQMSMPNLATAMPQPTPAPVVMPNFNPTSYANPLMPSFASNMPSTTIPPPVLPSQRSRQRHRRSYSSTSSASTSTSSFSSASYSSPSSSSSYTPRHRSRRTRNPLPPPPKDVLATTPYRALLPELPSERGNYWRSFGASLDPHTHAHASSHLRANSRAQHHDFVTGNAPKARRGDGFFRSLRRRDNNHHHVPSSLAEAASMLARPFLPGGPSMPMPHVAPPSNSLATPAQMHNANVLQRPASPIIPMPAPAPTPG